MNAPPPDLRCTGEVAEVTVADGARLRYRVWSASGTARASVVLLNGIMSHAAWFAPLAPALTAAGFELVGADRRGSGLNEDDRGDAASAGQLVDDALAITEAAVPAARPLLVVGWCWGAALAVALTRKLGDRVSGLVLLTPGIWNTAAVKDAMAAQADRLATAAPDAPVIDSPIDEAWFTDGPAKDGFIRTDARRLRRITPRMVEVSGRLATSAAAALRTLQTPLLVVLADDDQATDNDATRAGVEALPADRRRIVTLPSKHGVQFDAPDPVARHLTAFASDLGL